MSTPRERRTRLDPDDRRAQLIALGVATLADRGLDALTIDEVAAAAGVSRALFSHYFGSRRGFHVAVLQAATEGMLTATVPDPALPRGARLRDTLTRTVGFVRAHSGTFSSFVRGAASGDPRARALVEASRVTQTDRVLDIFAEAGAAASPELRIAVRAWVAFVEQVLLDAALGSDRPTDQIVDLLVGALAAIAEHTQPGAAAALV